MSFPRRLFRILTQTALTGAILSATTIAATSLTGCKPDAAVEKGAVIDRGTKSPAAPPANEPQHASDPVPSVDAPPAGPTGDVAGTISFVGKLPPGPHEIDTSMDPACSLSSSGKLPVEQYAVKNGKLANVFLYVKSGPTEAMQAAPRSSQPVILDQKNCQYVPHVLGVVAGGYVEFRNSDPTMHNVHTTPADPGDPGIDISMGPRGAAQVKQFKRPELMLPVRCNNHPWMNAFLNVSPTPFFAVSDANGHFELRGLPPGDYVLGAVQEKMGEKTINITVKPRSTTPVNLNFSAS